MNKLQKFADFQQVSSSHCGASTKCLSEQSEDCGGRRPRDSFNKEKHTGAAEEGGGDGDWGVFGESRQKKGMKRS